MNEIVNVILLGIIQGLTEFLPISSSGHLILFREFFGTQGAYDLAFDAVLQLATTFAVFVYFRKDILKYIEHFLLIVFRKGDLVEKQDKILLFAIMIGTIPGVIAGLLLESSMETIFRNGSLVAGSLVVGALVMALAEWVIKKRKIDSENNTTTDESKGGITIKRGLLVGCFQALALIPGFSRSGMTISGGLFAGLTREMATRFSFLLAFPILVGSGAKKILDLAGEGVLQTSWLQLMSGSVAAFVVGILAIHFLLSYLKKNTLMVFVWYRLVLAVVILILL